MRAVADDQGREAAVDKARDDGKRRECDSQMCEFTHGKETRTNDDERKGGGLGGHITHQSQACVLSNCSPPGTSRNRCGHCCAPTALVSSSAYRSKECESVRRLTDAENLSLSRAIRSIARAIPSGSSLAHRIASSPSLPASGMPPTAVAITGHPCA